MLNLDNIAELVQAIAASIALFSLLLISRQISLFRREARSRLMHELEIDARSLNTILWELDKDPDWITKEMNQKDLVFAMPFFEKLAIFVREGILMKADVKILFGYRIRQFLGNEHVWKHVEKNSNKMDFVLIHELKTLAFE